MQPGLLYRNLQIGHENNIMFPQQLREVRAKCVPGRLQSVERKNRDERVKAMLLSPTKKMKLEEGSRVRYE